MPKKPSAETQLREFKRKLRYEETAHQETKTLSIRNLDRAVQAETRLARVTKELAEWKNRFDLLLKLTG